MKKKVWWTIGIIAVLGILFFVLRRAGIILADKGLKVAVEKTARRTISEIVTASGKIYPEIEVKMSPDISGEIVELNVQEGDSVRKGQELAKIYADIYAVQRSQAAAQVSQQQALVSNVAAQLPGLKAALDQAQAQFDRQKQLVADKVISQSEFEQAQSTLKSADANYNAAQQNVKGNSAGVLSAQANLDIADKNVRRTSLVSPISGVISQLNVKKGERVVGNNMMTGTEMMRVADMTRIEVIVDVGENDIPKVHIDDSAEVEVDAYNNRKFPGVVTQIAASTGSQSSGSGSSSSIVPSSNDVTNYKVHVRLSPSGYQDLFDPAHPKNLIFRPGMTANADIKTKTHVSVLSVAINAVTTRTEADSATRKADNIGPQEIVFVLQPDNTVKKVPVKTSIQDINNIEILSGLSEGQQVVTAPYGLVSKTLKDGTLVQVVAKDKLFEAKTN